jgi:hypothetical protein
MSGQPVDRAGGAGHGFLSGDVRIIVVRLRPPANIGSDSKPVGNIEMSYLLRNVAPLSFLVAVMLFGASARSVLGQPLPARSPVSTAQAATGAGVPANAAMAAGNDAQGTLVYKTRSATLKYAWLVKGPYAEDPSKTVRRLILSAKDISAELQACKTIMCADGQVTEGMTVDFDVSRRLNYWVGLNDQKVQYSGTVTPDAFAARANDGGHLAGKLVIDDVAAGGPKIDAEFNVTLFKEFKPDR